MDNVIVVASGKGGTGKSTVCICLSVALVKQGKRVLLIDCDCGMRGLDIMLDMEQDIIFDASDAVCGNCTFGEAIYKSKNNENLYLMAAPFDTENELSPSVFTQLVDSVKDSFDFVLIDSPAGIGSGFETAATILGGSTALGYMVIGLLAFVLGACVTILCFHIHQLNKEEQTEKQKGDNGDGADQ